MFVRRSRCVQFKTRCPFLLGSFPAFVGKSLKSQPTWRYKSQKTSAQYKDTLNLPSTTFPLSIKNGIQATREIEIRKTFDYDGLYSWQKDKLTSAPTFTLHDGPPYANGKAHVGHAFNKILKDIICRFWLMRGHKIHFVPGWDTHGLPTELKVLGDQSNSSLSPQQLRNEALKIAEGSIELQKSAFCSWGLMADWSDIYRTCNPEYEANELEVWFTMWKKGLIYEEFMPVFWSPSSRTALAEAELEYNDAHTSPSLFFKLRLSHLPDSLQSICKGNNTFALIWTTTPWTVPANTAVAFSPHLDYVVAECGEELVILAEPCVDYIVSECGLDLKVIATLPGRDLSDVCYEHPIYKDRVNLPFVPADHVTAEKGSGLVHTAPAHGHDDFRLALKHGLLVESLVDELGCYTNSSGPALSGKNVLTDANEAVLSILGTAVVHLGSFTHSYPYDWRSKKPVIIRASNQWFIDTSAIKQQALDALEDVGIYPHGSLESLRQQVAHRPYWCISRQRVWGVPLPVFYHKHTGKALITNETVGHVIGLIREHGSDIWWSADIETLLPQSLLSQSGEKSVSSDYERSEHILDVWFDSGTSWSSVLSGNIADLYLEGQDQFRGWFHSSLLTSVSYRNQSPYKNIYVHGFVVDEHGRKMSKSVGNVIDPMDVVNGSKKLSAYGCDVLRYWAAAGSAQSSLQLGVNVLNRCQESVFRLRKSLRFLLSQIYDFDYENGHVDREDMFAIDRYLLHQTALLNEKVMALYSSYQLHRVPSEIDSFVSNTLSSLYCTAVKDRLYCSAVESSERRSAQMACSLCLSSLSKLIAPILPHLADEIQLHRSRDTSIFREGVLKSIDKWEDESLSSLFSVVLAVRDDLNAAIPDQSLSSYNVFLSGSDSILHKLQKLQSESKSSHSSLCECFGVASVCLSATSSTAAQFSRIININYCGENTEIKLSGTLSERSVCPRCRRHLSPKPSVVCSRCLSSMSQGWD